MQRLASTGGVTVAVHDLGGEGTPLLVSHATGFHAHCYAPLAAELADRFHSFGLDHRGHGASTQPIGWAGEPLDWRGCGDDAELAALSVAGGGEGGGEGGIVGFGHSMGGATLLMAASRRPHLFARLVLFEPIVFPPPTPPVDPEAFPLVPRARRRRATFESLDAAFENYRNKAPMSLFEPAALHAYVDYGLRPVSRDPADGVELCCAPAFEAATFAGSSTNGVWELLADIGVAVTVLAGRDEDDQPSRGAPAIAEALPQGTFVSLPHMTHFGPFSHVAEIADLVRRSCSAAM